MNTDSENSSATDPNERVLDTLFVQINEHLRATETKHLQISLAYMALLALALSILAGPGSSVHRSVIAHATSQQLIAYCALIAVGCMTIFIQDAYRGWKRHYMRIAKMLADDLGADDRFLPYWLKLHPRDHPYIVSLSADNALTYFTAAATTVLVGILSFIVAALVKSDVVQAVLITGTWVGFVSFLAFVRLRVYRRLRLFDDEDTLVEGSVA
jgi:FtsH-binding integral membrane protein